MNIDSFGAKDLGNIGEKFGNFVGEVACQILDEMVFGGGKW